MAGRRRKTDGGRPGPELPVHDGRIAGISGTSPEDTGYDAPSADTWTAATAPFSFEDPAAADLFVPGQREVEQYAPYAAPDIVAPGMAAPGMNAPGMKPDMAAPDVAAPDVAAPTGRRRRAAAAADPFAPDASAGRTATAPPPAPTGHRRAERRRRAAGRPEHANAASLFGNDLYSAARHTGDTRSADPYSADPYSADPYAVDPYSAGPLSPDPYATAPDGPGAYAADPYATGPSPDGLSPEGLSLDGLSPAGAYAADAGGTAPLPLPFGADGGPGTGDVAGGANLGTAAGLPGTTGAERPHGRRRRAAGPPVVGPAPAGSAAPTGRRRRAAGPPVPGAAGEAAPGATAGRPTGRRRASSPAGTTSGPGPGSGSGAPEAIAAAGGTNGTDTADGRPTSGGRRRRAAAPGSVPPAPRGSYTSAPTGRRRAAPRTDATAAGAASHAAGSVVPGDAGTDDEFLPGGRTVSAGTGGRRAASGAARSRRRREAARGPVRPWMAAVAVGAAIAVATTVSLTGEDGQSARAASPTAPEPDLPTDRESSAASRSARVDPAQVARNTAASKVLTQALAKAVPYPSGNLAVGVYDPATDTMATTGGDRHFATASVVKVDIAATLLLQSERQGRQVSPQLWSMIEVMIRKSDNDATFALWDAVGRGPGLSEGQRAFGMIETTTEDTWGLTSTTVGDRLRLMNSLTSDDSPLSAASRTRLLQLMGSVVPDQVWGISAAADRGTRIELKNGWLPRSTTNLWVINSFGRVTVDGRQVLVAVLQDDQRSMDAGMAQAERAIGQSVPAVVATFGKQPATTAP